MQESRKRLRVSPSLIISILALIIASSAGAYAVTIAPKNSVVSKSIKNGEVKSKDLAANSVNTKKIKDGSITSADIGDGQVGTTDIGDGQVGTTDIGDGQVGTADLSSAAKADLNDAATLGGLTIAQIVAASGGEYVEARQAAGSPSIEVLPANRITVATLNIPHAGKWLVNATIPVQCSWDGTGASTTDPEPDETGLNQANFPAQGALQVGPTIVDTQDESCEVETGVLAVIVPVYTGTTTINFSRMITTTGPTTVTLKASGAASNLLGTDIIPGFKANATASESLLQGITVQ